jgi:citrate synthase
VLPESILRLMKMLPPSDGMDALRTLTSALGHYDPDASDNSAAAAYRKAVRLTGQIASLVATWGRMQQGGGPIAPDPAMGHAASFLYMLTGSGPAHGGPGDGRRAHAARRPRAERLHLRRARGRGHAHRHPLRHRRRHRRR